MNDNRNYIYSSKSSTTRVEYEIISKWVGKGKKVIDLGCGDGSLLSMLKDQGNITTGIDISQSAVKEARKKGIRATKNKIDSKLPFRNNQFDYSICVVTIQMLMYPEILLKEMARISRYQIYSFPNFGFLLNRLDLFFLGRFPRYTLFGYSWYNTGHIHQLSLKDFENFIHKQKFNIIRSHPFIFNSMGMIPGKILGRFPNCWATSAVYLTKNER